MVLEVKVFTHSKRSYNRRGNDGYRMRSSERDAEEWVRVS
jgi:hypothetical protein